MPSELVECWACKGTGSLRLPDDCGYCRGEGEVLPEVNDDAHMDRDPSVRALIDPRRFDHSRPLRPE